MNAEMLRRRFMALSAALAGGTMLRPLNAAAEAKNCYALEKDAEQEWDYVCGDSGKWCDLRKNGDKMAVELGPESKLQAPPRGTNSFVIAFKDERPITEVGLPPPGVRTARSITVTFSFTEVNYKGRVTDWGEISGWKGFRFALTADGKEVATSTSQYSGQAGLPVDVAVQALRGTTAARAALHDASNGQLVIALDFSSKGFGPMYDAARGRFDANRAWLVGGNVCAPGERGQPCFFTTAACNAVGLAEDCFELTMMRRLRDHCLVRTAEGRAEVAAYYDVAPPVVAALLSLPDARRRLLRLYAVVILPGALLVRVGLFSAARRLYRRVVRNLAREFQRAHPLD
jgi:hypothetical protein